MKENIPPGFCVLPWNHTYLQTNGQYRVCCYSEPDTVIDPKTGEPYSVKTHSFEDFLNSEYAENIRQEMLAGGFPEACRRCYAIENRGGTSKRFDANHWIYPHLIDPILNGNMKHLVTYIELRPGNLCNLKCRMCDPTSSSQVEKDHIERMEDTGLNLYPQKLQRSYDTNWFYPKGFDELKVISKDLERVSILGGEPTIMPEVIDYMTYLIENDYAKNISLRITTNATNINSTILNLLRQFKKPLVTISVDGIGDVDRYIRYPTNWKKKEENIKNILSVLSDCAIDFCCTYQVLNSLNLEEMVKWYLDLNFPYGILYFNRLFFPEDLQISLLPLEYRLQMADKLEPYLIHKRLKSLNGIVGLLRNAPVPDPELYAKFWSRTEALDNQRSYKFQDALPELYEILSKYR